MKNKKERKLARCPGWRRLILNHARMCALKSKRPGPFFGIKLLKWVRWVHSTLVYNLLYHFIWVRKYNRDYVLWSARMQWLVISYTKKTIFIQKYGMMNENLNLLHLNKNYHQICVWSMTKSPSLWVCFISRCILQNGFLLKLNTYIQV